MEGLEQKKKKKSAVKEVVSWLVYLIIFAAVAFFLIHYVGERTVVSGDSMLPTLQNGDNLIVDKLSYRFRDPKRFEIVVFPFRYQEDTYYIKRIIGLPGETVQIHDGNIYINGKQLKEDYGRETIRNPGLASEAVTLGEDEYFFSGITEITAQTVVSQVLETFRKRIFSDVHGCVSGHLTSLGC